VSSDYASLNQARTDAADLVAELERIRAAPPSEVHFATGYGYPRVEVVWYRHEDVSDDLVKSLARHFTVDFEATVHQGTAWRSGTTDEFGRSEVEFTIFSK
jgi:hypothetical protein